MPKTAHTCISLFGAIVCYVRSEPLWAHIHFVLATERVLHHRLKWPTSVCYLDPQLKQRRQRISVKVLLPMPCTILSTMGMHSMVVCGRVQGHGVSEE